MNSMDYQKEWAEIENLIQQQRYRNAVKVIGVVLENGLRDIYGQVNLNAQPRDVKRLLEIEEKISRGKETFQ